MAARDAYLTLADFLIPAHTAMPAFSEVCSRDDALAALDFRADLRDGFARALATDLAEGPEAHLERLNRADREAFTALTTVTIATYYMNPRVRELIGYPGQESVSYDPTATPAYITDGSLAQVVARGRRYRPTPGL